MGDTRRDDCHICHPRPRPPRSTVTVRVPDPMQGEILQEVVGSAWEIDERNVLHVLDGRRVTASFAPGSWLNVIAAVTR